MGSALIAELSAAARTSVAETEKSLQPREVADARLARAKEEPAAPPPDQTVRNEGSRALEEAAKVLGARDSSHDRLDIRVDEEYGGVIVRIVDGEGRLVRQIPPEELVALAQRLNDVFGVLFDRKI